MWQDVLLAVDHEHASEFVSTILDAPGAAKPSDPLCQAQAKQKAGKRESSQDARFFFFQDRNYGLQILSEWTTFSNARPATLGCVKASDFRPEDIQSATIVHLILRLVP